MALQKEIWLEFLVANLFPDNSFLARSFNADAFVKAGKVVHIPNAGEKQTANVGPISRPKVAKEQTDTELTFTIKEIYTDPVYIQNADKYELSYDKRAAVLSATRSALNDKLATEMLKSWIPSEEERKIELQAATFGRKDVLAAETKLNLDDVPLEGRTLLLNAQSYEQLLSDLTEAQVNAFLAAADATKGTIGRLYSFDVMLRSVMPDKALGLAWHRDYVCRAQGEHEMFVHDNDPLYYADVLSAIVRAGGSPMKKDGTGIVTFKGKED